MCALQKFLVMTFAKTNDNWRGPSDIKQEAQKYQQAAQNIKKKKQDKEEMRSHFLAPYKELM